MAERRLGKGAGNTNRKKGNRVELEFVYLLRKDGYEARRVPLSGAMEGYKGDVVATKGDKKYTFELKAKAKAFTTLYSMYMKYRGEDSALRFVLDEKDIFAIGIHMHVFESANGLYMRITPDNPDYKLFTRVRKMYADWTKGCDFLALKGNRQPFLIIRHWGQGVVK